MKLINFMVKLLKNISLNFAFLTNFFFSVNNSPDKQKIYQHLAKAYNEYQ